MPDRAAPVGDPLGLVPQLVALAGDQAETRAQVTELAGTLGELVDRVSGLVADAEHVGGQLDAVRTAVEELASAIERLSAEPDRTPVWTWVDMDTDTRRGALRELATWVDDVLVARYQLDDRALPRCWYRHPAAVEELSWLYQDWTRVYRGGRGTSTSAAGEWHDRWLPGVLTRITKALAGCAMREHRPPHGPPNPAVDSSFEAFLNTLDAESVEPSAAARPWQDQQSSASPPWERR